MPPSESLLLQNRSTAAVDCPSSPPLSFPSETAMLDPASGGGGKGSDDRSGFGEIRFSTEGMARAAEDGDSGGVCSPPLWRTSPSSTPSAGNSPPRLHRRRRNLSPASRAQAIARGRRELMEMVRDVPESSYELSLKDLVEHLRPGEKAEVKAQATRSGSESAIAEDQNQQSRKGERKGKMKKSRSLDNGGFLLKMVLPIGLGSKKKNKNKKKRGSGTNGGACAKVSPKPQTAAAGDGSGKGGEREWWKRKSNASGESRSSSGGSQRSSSCSSNSCKSSRHVSGLVPRCWAFLRRGRRSKNCAAIKANKL